jgi:hypothetical protein
MAIVYCQLYSGEKLLSDRLLVSIERGAGPHGENSQGCTFRVPNDQSTTIRADKAMRLVFPANIARRLKITEGNSLHIVAHTIHDHIVHFDEARVSEE